MNLLTKAAHAVKADASGRITGIANETGVVDGGNDMTMPGAFRDNLREHGPYRPLLFGHSMAEPIGVVELAETARGLEIVEGFIEDSVQRAREVLALLTMKPRSPLQGFSIGYETLKESYQGGVRQLHKLNVWEVSVVVIPMNAGSVVRSVGKDDADDFAAALRQLTEKLRAQSVADDIHEIFRRARAAAIQ
jgi:HK97 family phage prohead protease